MFNCLYFLACPIYEMFLVLDHLCFVSHHRCQTESDVTPVGPRSICNILLVRLHFHSMNPHTLPFSFLSLCPCSLLFLCSFPIIILSPSGTWSLSVPITLPSAPVLISSYFTLFSIRSHCRLDSNSFYLSQLLRELAWRRARQVGWQCRLRPVRTRPWRSTCRRPAI